MGEWKRSAPARKKARAAALVALVSAAHDVPLGHLRLGTASVGQCDADAPAGDINGGAVRVLVHRRLHAGCVNDPQHANVVVLELHGLVHWVNCHGVVCMYPAGCKQLRTNCCATCQCKP